MPCVGHNPDKEVRAATLRRAARINAGVTSLHSGAQTSFGVRHCDWNVALLDENAVGKSHEDQDR